MQHCNMLAFGTTGANKYFCALMTLIIHFNSIGEDILIQIKEVVL